MSETAPQPVIRTVPAAPDLEAETSRLLAGLRAAASRLEADPASKDAARHLIDVSHKLYDFRAQIAESNAAADLEGLVYRAARAEGYAEGRRDERAEQEARQPLPRQRRGGGSHARQGVVMRLVEGGKAAVIPAAAAFWVAARHAGPALRHGSHAALTVHRALKIKLAAAALAVPAGGALVAVAVLGPSQTLQDIHGWAGGQVTHGAGAWHASPVPSQRFEADVTKTPKRKHPAGTNATSSLPYLPPYPPAAATSPATGPSSSSPAAQASAQAGPAQLMVSTTAIDLSGSLTSEAITLSASGAGWVSWKVDTTDPQTGAAQTDLDFSATHGVLQAGQSETVTVSLDASLDGASAEIFTIGGQPVTAALPPLPVPVPSVLPSALPSVLPSL